MGYAYKGSNEHKRLLNGKAVKTIPIDYSFNEITRKIERAQISDGKYISVYSLIDLIAEKYRAILQQKGRNRARRQDAFDLFYLFKMKSSLTKKDKKEILNTLILKSESRGLFIDCSSIDSKEIEVRSKSEYHQLKQEVEGELPPFDETFSRIKSFCKSLPWE